MCEERIVSDPKILRGKPTIKGTRISVELLLEEMSGGATPEELAREFQIEVADVQAALAFAARALSVDVVYPVVAESR